MNDSMRQILGAIAVIFLVFLFSHEGGGSEVKSGIRKSVIAGSWYPGNTTALKNQVEEYLANTPADAVDGIIVALVSPHAGYAYSGQVAAHSYKQIAGKVFDSVIIIGPSHRAYFQGASIYNDGGYETPLGIVKVDKLLADAIIAQSDVVSINPAAHVQEHSVEIQLPFLQVVLGDFPFVPVVMGSQDRRTCEALSAAVAAVTKNKNVLIVASSDLSHFHGYDRATAMDAIALKHIEKMDWQGLLADLDSGSCEACGGGPVAAAIMIAQKRGADSAKILKYANSGDVTGDRQGVVGYAAAVFYKKHAAGRSPAGGDAGVVSGLSDDEKRQLLAIARKSIELQLRDQALPEFSRDLRSLHENRGAFVTLKKNEELRGCIGSFEARGSLYKTVEEMARSAAFHDPRFPPVSANELKEMKIEISVLSPLRKIKSIDEIEVGKHGIYVMRGMYRGVLLPQVATQYNWDKVTFLEETCHKAGLPANAWKDGETEIYVFSADIFAEHQ